MYSDGSIACVPSLAAITLKPPKLSKIFRRLCDPRIPFHGRFAGHGPACRRATPHVLICSVTVGTSLTWRVKITRCLMSCTSSCTMPRALLPSHRDPVRLQRDEVRDQKRHPQHAFETVRNGHEHGDSRAHLHCFANHPACDGFGAALRFQTGREQSARHPANRSPEERGQRSSARWTVEQPPCQRRTQGQNHLRRHHLERRDTRGTTYFRTKQRLRLCPRQRNSFVILCFSVPRIVEWMIRRVARLTRRRGVGR